MLVRAWTAQCMFVPVGPRPLLADRPIGDTLMNSLDQVYERASVLRQRNQTLASQRSELEELRDRVLKTEQSATGRMLPTRRAYVGKPDLGALEAA
jgi:hypothetical protein